MSVSVEVLEDDEYAAWTRLVSDSPDGGVYSLPEYLDVLCTAAGGRFRVLAARRGDEIAGGVALYECDSRYGPYVAPRRLLHYNGPVLRRYATRYPSEQTARDLKTLGALAEAIGQRGYSTVTLNCASSLADVRPFLAAGWTARPEYTYVVATDDLPRQWSRVEQNLRRLVNRCEREGVALREDDDFDAFFALHAQTMARVGAPTYLSASSFRRYFEALRARGWCRLFHARRADGRVLATQLVLLGPHPVSHTVAAGADQEFLQMGATAFLRWKALEALGAAGYVGNDLTDASLNAVTHFKSQLGGDLKAFLSLQGPRSLRYRVGHGAVTAVRRTLAAVRRSRAADA
jgi:CelD/BcsL family acetyltransferase involved in cellulose biosynthesis